MGCYLLGQRGIDKWLSGRLKLESLLDNLAREWASLPTFNGMGYYSGQKCICLRHAGHGSPVQGQARA